VTRTVHLHLGLPKTGTTTIQSVLFGARERLRAEGIVYPGFAENHSAALRSIFAPAPHRIAANRLRGAGTPEAAAAMAAQWSDKLEAALAEPGWRELVLSAESASYLPPDRLVQLRDRLMTHADRVIVAVCLRHPFDIRVSLIQEHLKTGGTIAEAVERLSVPGHYRRIIARIRGAFGAENLRLGLFEAMVAEPDGLARAFGALIDLPGGLVPADGERRRNQRMSQRACLVLDRLNREVPLTVEGGRNPRRSRHVDLIVRALPGPRFALTPEQAEAMRDAVADDIACGAEVFGREVWTPGAGVSQGGPPEVGWVGPVARIAGVAGRFLP
jgi:hypothetical protein